MQLEGAELQGRVRHSLGLLQGRGLRWYVHQGLYAAGWVGWDFVELAFPGFAVAKGAATSMFNGST